jgi:hypothetical protein
MRCISIGALIVAIVSGFGCGRHPTAAEREQQEQEREQTLLMEKMLNAAVTYGGDGGMGTLPEPTASAEAPASSSKATRH